MFRLAALILSLACAAQDPKLLKGLEFRSIGPNRGGRVVAVTGVPSQPNVYYFGGTGGGIWKTTDGGLNWRPITDGQLNTGSVGALAVSDSNPNIVYAGMGEQAIRGNASHGDGVYKSTDAGKTWKHLGLADTRQIGRVRVHPRNPDLVYVCALGHMSGPNEQRGIFKSIDGGKTWKQTFTRGPEAGCVDLAVDPSNPDVMYAGFWQVIRRPWSMESGGKGSGLFKSTDGGDTWKEIGHNPGAPKGLQGKIGVAVSPANPERLWAIIEADDGGVFRSDDGGDNWTRVNQERNLRQRAWYYSRIYADPLKPNTVYVLNVGFFRSDDGGKTFTAIQTPHGDNHDLWIAPNNSDRMIQSNDGGANVSTNGGRVWTAQNQATAQFYRVFADNQFPYIVYGAQQDNTTIRIASRGNGGSITEKDWWDVGGGESGWIAPDPKDPNIVYAGSYSGYLTRYDHRTGNTTRVDVWPDNPMGYGADGMRYRFQWNFPLLYSPHDPTTLYAAGNILFKTNNGGRTWEPISGDLTRNDRSKQGPSGGPITRDNTGVEYYCTIFTVDESKLTKGLIWAGSDDGLVHVTRDGGKKWDNVTPRGIPEWIQINSIEASPHDPAKAYIAATMYKSDDLRPYLYRTTDYGKSWTKIVNGIDPAAFTRVIREDPNRKGLLFSGTETGLYISYDDGDNWQKFNLNIPTVPITDLTFHKRDNDLIVATQGRSFWILDDLHLVQQLKPDTTLFAPEETYRISGGFGRRRGPAPTGANPPGGVVVHYMLKEKAKEEVVIEILDASGKLVKKFSTKDKPPAADGETAAATVPNAAGLNQFVWDMRHPDAATFPGLIYWAGSNRGPLATTGRYQVKLTVDGQSYTQPFVLKKDPRTPGTQEDFDKQLQLSIQVRDKVTQANEAVSKIRDVRKQIDEEVKRMASIKDAAKAIEAGKKLAKDLTAIEEEIYQTKLQSNQDPLNFPIKLNNKLAALLSVIQQNDGAPTAQVNQVFEDLATKLNAQLKRLDGLITADIVAFNKLVRDAQVPAVIVK